MPELENPNNNQFRPPSPPTLPTAASLPALTSSDTHSVTETYNIHPRFYYHDGSVVFLVGNTLFKFQASLIAADVKDYGFKHILKDAIDGFKGDVDRPGTRGANPVVLPNDVTAAQFEDFLMALYGGVTNKTFVSFLSALQAPTGHTPLLLSRLNNIGHLGCRFGMKSLDAWSQAQIYTILHGIANVRPLVEDWDAQVILRLVQYVQVANATPYRPILLNRMRHIMSALVEQAYKLNNEIPQGSSINICAALYRHKDLLIKSPGFFGFIFAVIISLGHQSPIWVDYLTREDRRVLYVAHASFTRLGNHVDLEVGWLIDPAPIKEACSQCSNQFDTYWGGSFSQCGGLTSRMPSEDMRHIVSLPVYLTRFWSASKTNSCKCAHKMADNIGERIETLYCNFTEKYKFLAQTV